jgi:exonuclease SbcD
MTFDSVDKAVAWLAENQDAYVELTMVSNEYLNAEDSSRIYASHKWILDLIPQSKNSTISGLTQQAQTIDIQLDKSELFESFFIQKKGQEPSLELKKLFHEILNS